MLQTDFNKLYLIFSLECMDEKIQEPRHDTTREKHNLKFNFTYVRVYHSNFFYFFFYVDVRQRIYKTTKSLIAVDGRLSK